VVGAALAQGEHAEIILDLLHVGAGAAAVALRAIPNLYGITDAVAAAGMPEGEYRLGRHRVLKDAGAVRLEDGTLAGSTLTMDQVLRNLLALGLSLEEASRRVSTIAADYLGLRDRGRLVPEALADIVVLDQDHAIAAVFVAGERIDLTDA
jgi:N-acetylglucosamine-6-phosphate deacetylase